MSSPEAQDHQHNFRPRRPNAMAEVSVPGLISNSFALLVLVTLILVLLISNGNGVV